MWYLQYRVYWFFWQTSIIGGFDRWLDARAMKKKLVDRGFPHRDIRLKWIKLED